MQESRKVKIIFTSDVHGNYFPYDFRHEHWGKGSLQRVHAFIADLCQKEPGSTILVDGGDMLQGEPTAYYFNKISTDKRHKVADICNFIGYDVGVIGNHDIEMGHDVFDKFVSECNYPILGANAIDDSTGEPYFEPYHVFFRSGVKIAIIGMITPAIPHWIPKAIWSGIHFEDIRESSEKWVKYVKEQENPDFIIGLLHSGMDEGINTPEYKENATRETAINVEGFDLILYGHDHSSNMEEVTTKNGKNVMCINPGCYAYSVAVVDINFTKKNDKVISHDTNCSLNYIGTLHNLHGNEFKRHFSRAFNDVKRFTTQKIGVFTNRVDVTDAYFGSSAYIDLIQDLQLKVSGAEISFTAPLFFNAAIEAGTIKVSNLFDLYRFEDHLYTMLLKGSEIKNYLEMSYANWTNQMTSENDNLLLISPMKSNPERMGFKNFIFNFDSAAGICYEVDVREPEGQKIKNLKMEDGSEFAMDRMYKVTMTAYRANGGGELLTKGAQLSKSQIEERIICISKYDIRHYLMEYVKELNVINPQPHNHWHFIPEEWVEKATKREKELLFGSNKV